MPCRQAFFAALETDSKLIEAAWRRSPRFYDDNYIDLACFTKNLRKKADAELQAKVVDLIAALKAGKGRAILCQGKIGRQVRGTCGLSIYFPGDRINSASGEGGWGWGAQTKIGLPRKGISKGESGFLRQISR